MDRRVAGVTGAVAASASPALRLPAPARRRTPRLPAPAWTLMLTLALALAAACGKSGAKSTAGADGDGAASAGAATRGAGPAAAGDGGTLAEPDAAPVAPADVLEGTAAETAMTEALARDAGAGPAVPAPVPGEPVVSGLGHDGVAGFRLGQTRAEAVGRLGPGVPLVRQPRPSPDAPLAEEALLRAADGAAWLRLRIYAGRVVELEVRARDGRALTDEGIGVGSSFEEAVLAHGDARAVEDEKSGRVRGWVLADLPGVLWIPAGAPIVGDAETAPPEGSRIGRVLVLGPEALAPPD